MFLFDRNQSKFIYVLKASFLSLLIAFTLVIVISQFVNLSEIDGPDVDFTLVDFIGSTFIGPALETLLMIPILWLIARFTENVVLAAIVSALIWSVMHSLSYPLWGLFTFCSFVILSIAYQVWREVSAKAAFCITYCIHGVINGVSVSLSLLAAG